MNSALETLRSLQTWVVVLLCVSAATIAVSALLVSGRPGWGVALAIALVVNYIADAELYKRAHAAARWMGSRQLGSAPRSVFRQVFALIGWILAVEPTGALVAVVVTTVVCVHTSHFVYRVLGSRNRIHRAGRLKWANLEVNGEQSGPSVLPPTLPVIAGVGGPRLLLFVDVFLMIGLGTSGLVPGGSIWPVLGGCALTALACVVALAKSVARNRLIQRLPKPAEENAALIEALAATAPEVAIYFSGGSGTTYQLNVWLETLDRLDRPAMIILREARHLTAMLPCRIPIIVLPGAQDVESVHFDSLKVALYPTTVINNNHMIRLRGISHIFINHGDGDKSVTYSPLHRVFDEIWVAGQAAVDRYLDRGEGVRREQLREVGRPQLATIKPWQGQLSADDRLTVLYAPTWEGNFEGVNYSSVAPMGEAIIAQLLSIPSVRVLFKAHPATGSRLPAAAAAWRAIESKINASPGHEIVGSAPSALYDAFNDADVLISDVSSVVADFLASRKPYLITNPKALRQAQGTSAASFHESFPSTRGGGIIAPDAANLAELIMEIRQGDPMREQRNELSTYFLGEPRVDPIGEFVAAIDAACDRVPARHRTDSDADVDYDGPSTGSGIEDEMDVDTAVSEPTT